MRARLQRILKNHEVQRFLKTVKERMTTSELSNTSVVVAYYLLLSLFPLLIAVGNILPVFKINPASVLPYIAEIIPKDIYDMLKAPIQNLLTTGSGSLFSVSALGTIWGASKSINALQTAMNKVYGVEDRPNFILVRLVSLGTIFLLLLAVGLAVVFFGLGQTILDFIGKFVTIPGNFLSLFSTVKWPLTCAILFVIMSILYLIVPNAKVRVRSVLPGAAFATVGWLLLSQVFGLYARYFSGSAAGYQVIGSFIILMFWLNFAASIILLGCIVNAVLEEFLGGDIYQRKNPATRIKEQLLENRGLENDRLDEVEKTETQVADKVKEGQIKEKS